jgi:hypothetical protein
MPRCGGAIRIDPALARIPAVTVLPTRRTACAMRGLLCTPGCRIALLRPPDSAPGSLYHCVPSEAP